MRRMEVGLLVSLCILAGLAGYTTGDTPLQAHRCVAAVCVNCKNFEAGGVFQYSCKPNGVQIFVCDPQTGYACLENTNWRCFGLKFPGPDCTGQYQPPQGCDILCKGCPRPVP